MTSISRRSFIATGLTAAGVLTLGPSFWGSALAAPATLGEGPYGPLLAPDANGISLPEGFTSRQIARAGQTVPGTSYVWHPNPDGQATFAEPDGGWVLVSNSESSAASGGGSSSIRFAPDGEIRGAFRICGGTNTNCAGGRTPWGTWLTCEEHGAGQVWECDPLGRWTATTRPAMGVFKHEAVAVDPANWHLYMTEDEPNGCLYRFAPFNYPDLTAGLLELAVVDGAGLTTWEEVPDPSAIRTATRSQVPAAAHFNGGEGIWFDSGTIYFSTKGDNSLWSYDTATTKVEKLYDPAQSGNGSFLTGPDNLTVSRSHDLFVCEDNGASQFDVVMVTPNRVASSFLRCSGSIHAGSELAGVVFSPDGERMYVSSQRGYGSGAVFEITGPFRPGPTDDDDDDDDGGETTTPTTPTETTPTTPTTPADTTPTTPAPEPPPTQTLPTVVPIVVDPQGPPSLPGKGDHVDAPGLQVTTVKRITLSSLREDGLAVDVRVHTTARVEIALRTSDLGTVPGKRGSAPRARTVTLGARTQTIRAGRKTRLRVRLKPSEIRRLQAALDHDRRDGHKQQVTARLVIQARPAAGGKVAIANRNLTIVPAPKPKKHG